MSFFGQRDLTPEQKYEEQQAYYNHTLRNESPTSRDIRLGKERLYNEEVIKQINDNQRVSREGQNQQNTQGYSSPVARRSPNSRTETSPGLRSGSKIYANDAGPRVGPGMMSPYRQKYHQIQEERSLDKMSRGFERSNERLRDIGVSNPTSTSVTYSNTRSPSRIAQVPVSAVVPTFAPRAGGVLARQRSREYINDTTDMMVDRRETVRSQDREEERNRRLRQAQETEEKNRLIAEEAERVQREQLRLQQQINASKLQAIKQATQSTLNSSTKSPTRYYSPTNRSPPKHDCLSHSKNCTTNSTSTRQSPLRTQLSGTAKSANKPDVNAIQREMTREMSKMQDELGDLRRELNRQRQSNGDLLREVQRVEGQVIPREVDRIEDKIDRQNRVISSIDPISPVVERRIVTRIKNDLSDEFTDKQQEILRENEYTNRELIAQQRSTQKMLRDLSLDMDIKEIKEESRHRSIQRTLNEVASGPGNLLSNAAKRSLSNSYSRNTSETRPSPYSQKFSASKDKKQLPYIDNSQVFLPTTNAFYSDINSTPQSRSVIGGRITPSSLNKQTPLSRLSANKSTPFDANASADFGGRRSSITSNGTGIPKNLDILDSIVQASNQNRPKVQQQRSAQKYNTLTQQQPQPLHYSTVNGDASPSRRNTTSGKKPTIAGKIINDLDGLLVDIKSGSMA